MECNKVLHLSNAKYGKMVEPYIALVEKFEPMVELEFNQKIINGIFENVENKADAFDYIKDLNSKNDRIRSKQQEKTIDSIKKEITDLQRISELQQQVNNRTL